MKRYVVYRLYYFLSFVFKVSEYQTIIFFACCLDKADVQLRDQRFHSFHASPLQDISLPFLALPVSNPIKLEMFSVKDSYCS